MINLSSPIVDFILSPGVIITVLILIGLYLAGYYWRKDSKRKLSNYLKNIRSHDIAIQRYNSLLTEFSELENTPPFSTQFDSILRKLAELHGNRDREMKLYTHLRGESDEYTQKKIFKKILAPYYWLQTRQKLNALEHIEEIVAQNIEEVNIDVHQLTHIQNEISRQIAIAWQNIQELEQNVQTLLQRRCRADTINPYKFTHEQLREKFITIPAYLLNPEEPQIRSEDTLKQISEAYSILSESKPALVKALDDTRLWLEQTELLPQAIKQITTTISRIRIDIRKLPRSIDTTQLYERLKEARLAIEYSEKFSKQIDPAHLESVLNALAKQYELLEKSDREIQTAEEILEKYQQYRYSLANQWQAADTLVSQLTSNPILPIQLIGTAEEMGTIRTALTNLADLRNAYPISRFQQETPVLQQQINKLHELQKNLLSMQQTQAELMTLMKRLEHSKLEIWIEKTRSAVEKVDEYAKENYYLPPNWKNINLEEELKNLLMQTQQFLPKISQTITEDRLIEVWTAAQDIDRMVSIIQDGINSQLQQRRDFIEQEKKIVEKHTAVLEEVDLLHQTDLLSEQNQYIRRFQRNLATYKQELAKRDQGTVAAKEEQLEKLSIEFHAQIDEWVTDAKESLQTNRAELDSIINDLSSKANLSDPLLDDVESFLNMEIMDGNAENDTGSVLVETFIDTLDQQKLSTDYLDELQKLRTTALQKLGEFNEIQSGFNTAMMTSQSMKGFHNSWNQNIIALERIHHQGSQFNKELDNFLQAEHHSQNLIRKLDQYIHRYEELIEKQNDLLDKINEERREQEQVESDLQQTMAQWRRVAEIWQQDQIVVENVDNLLKRYEKRYRDALQSYQNGRVRFASFITTLNNLNKHLSFEVITNENNRSIEISGKEYI